MDDDDDDDNNNNTGDSNLETNMVDGTSSAAKPTTKNSETNPLNDDGDNEECAQVTMSPVTPETNRRNEGDSVQTGENVQPPASPFTSPKHSSEAEEHNAVERTNDDNDDNENAQRTTTVAKPRERQRVGGGQSDTDSECLKETKKNKIVNNSSGGGKSIMRERTAEKRRDGNEPPQVTDDDDDEDVVVLRKGMKRRQRRIEQQNEKLGDDNGRAAKRACREGVTDAAAKMRQRQSPRSIQQDGGPDPFYDEIRAKLPAHLGATKLPTMCHKDGVWGHFVSDGHVSVLRQFLKDRCASLYMSANHPSWKGRVHVPTAFTYNVYCKERRSELHSNGWTVLPGVFSNCTLERDIERIIQHFAKQWGGERKITEGDQEENNQPWVPIYNQGWQVDDAKAKQGIGRYSVDVRYLVDECIEKYKDVFEKRALLETALGCIVQDVLADDNVENPLQFPATGSRLLFQTKRADAQRPHFDFDKPQYEEGKSMPWNPGKEDLSYFAMISGRDGFKVRVWLNGHKALYGPFTLTQEIGRLLPSHLVDVPPCSVLVMRGDMPHAGISGKDGDGPGESSGREAMHIRFHMYITRTISSLKDSVYLAAHNLRINDIETEEESRRTGEWSAIRPPADLC